MTRQMAGWFDLTLHLKVPDIQEFRVGNDGLTGKSLNSLLRKENIYIVYYNETLLHCSFIFFFKKEIRVFCRQPVSRMLGIKLVDSWFGKKFFEPVVRQRTSGQTQKLKKLKAGR